MAVHLFNLPALNSLIMFSYWQPWFSHWNCCMQILAWFGGRMARNLLFYFVHCMCLYIFKHLFWTAHCALDLARDHAQYKCPLLLFCQMAWRNSVRTTEQNGVTYWKKQVQVLERFDPARKKRAKTPEHARCWKSRRKSEKAVSQCERKSKCTRTAWWRKGEDEE